MSSKTIVILEDDVDGGEADETIEFGIDGTTYTIDLSDSNAKKLRGALDGYVSKARKVSGKRSTSRKSSPPIHNQAVREHGHRQTGSRSASADASRQMW
jgi:hypothetical protein